MTAYLSKKFTGVETYVPGEQPRDRSYIKLNTNESPFAPSPAVLAAISAAEVSSLNLYPDPDARAAAAAISGAYGLQPENILLGNGSDELLAFAFQAYCDGDTPAVYADITYGFYSVYARIYGAESKIIPLDDNFNINPSDYYGAAGTIFIANPNSPTGLTLPLSAIEGIVKENGNNVVVVDEAYVAFGGESAVPLIKKYENLLVIHTMSKSKNLAGARIGFALGQSGLIGDIKTMKFSFNPYNVGRLSLLAAEAAIGDDDYYNGCVEKIIKTRERAAAALRKRGFSVLPGKANFLFARPGFMNGKEYYLGLRERGVLVRHFTQKRIEGYVRVTIGDERQMAALLAATDNMIQENKESASK